MKPLTNQPVVSYKRVLTLLYTVVTGKIIEIKTENAEATATHQ